MTGAPGWARIRVVSRGENPANRATAALRREGAGISAAVLAGLVLLATGGVAAQETTASITGVVSDQTGAPLPGTGIIARSVGQGFVKEAVTSLSGAYTMPFLPVGEYEVTFTQSGFQAYVARSIRLHVNDRLTLNVALRVEGQQESVDVSAAAQLIQPTAAVQSLLGPAQVQELPLNNRNFVQLATLVPGTTSSLSDEVGIGLTSTVSVSFAGARRSAVNWFVDGASNVDVGSNITLLSTPTLESIEEFKVITSGYAAEWPRSGGGVVNVVTKSGNNQFRASAYEFLRNDALDANGFFRKQSTDPGIRDHPPRLRYSNFGYTVGGPVAKDRLFFFWSEEWRRIARAPASVVAQVPDPAWLADPGNANYVAPAERDPNAVRLLTGWPAPNLGRSAFQDTRPNEQDTRQEVLRLDFQIAPRWRFMARYTHDSSTTTEAGGLFFNTPVPDIATTTTRVPGHLGVAQLTTTISPRMLNELGLQLSGNAIRSRYGPDVRNTRGQFGLTTPELFPENRDDLIPQVAVTGLSSLGATQLFDNRYRNTTVTDSLSYQKGSHAFKAGALVAFERKDEISTSLTQGSFSFAAGGGFTAFQNFLRGNADGACGASCSYSEAEKEVQSRLRFDRYELYLQDSWKIRPGLTVDLGLRYALAPPVKDVGNLLSNFVPSRFDPAEAPVFANAAGTSLVAGSGDPTNGIVVAGRDSPHGRGIYGADRNNLQPRLGFSWDVAHDGRSVVRGGFGVYFDQPLVGIFLQNAAVNPPLASQPSVLNARLSNPAAGETPTTRAPSSLIATSDPFVLARTRQWNFGLQRRLYGRGVLDVGYVGSAGDHLIQPVDINQPQPEDVVARGSVNRARPYPGYAAITLRQTTARARYHGLLLGFRHEGGRAGTLNLAYTLSRTKTDATNDRDTIDLPQNPLDLGAEYAVARTDRTHVFTANYVYELPFFKSDRGWRQAVLSGWQVSGITELWSGPPISRVVNGTTNGGRRGSRVDQVGDPRAGLPPSVPGGVYWFAPGAFASPADGSYGNSGRAPFRLPGVNQWDITLSKNFYPARGTRLQFRADFINAFNHTQLDPNGIQNVCAAAVSDPTCAVPGSSFGQITATRSPREIQLGLRLSWN
jgi:hypothetical protein